MPRFLVDAMLGHVARDLRILGYDVAYDPAVDDDDLLRWARRDGRLLVTKDRVLAQRAGELGVLLAAPGREEDLPALVARLGLRPDPATFLARCSACGGALERVASATAEVPPAIAARHPMVSRCAECGHVYWEGTHVAAIRARLGGLVDDAPPAPEASTED